MEMAVKNGNVNKSDVTVLAARITGYGIETPPENGPNLVYMMNYLYMVKIRYPGRCMHHDHSKTTGGTGSGNHESLQKTIFYYSDP